MKTLIRQYRQELKDLAKGIKTKKGTRKSHKNGYVPGLFYDRMDFRYKHIAYCMLRGRKYEEIERSTKTPLTNFSWRQINKLMEVPRETTCVSEERPAVVA